MSVCTWRSKALLEIETRERGRKKSKTMLRVKLFHVMKCGVSCRLVSRRVSATSNRRDRVRARCARLADQFTVGISSEKVARRRLARTVTPRAVV